MKYEYWLYLQFLYPVFVPVHMVLAVYQFWLVLFKKKKRFLWCSFLLFYCNLPAIDWLDSQETGGFVASVCGDILVLSLSYCKWVRTDWYTYVFECVFLVFDIITRSKYFVQGLTKHVLSFCYLDKELVLYLPYLQGMDIQTLPFDWFESLRSCEWSFYLL